MGTGSGRVIDLFAGTGSHQYRRSQITKLSVPSSKSLDPHPLGRHTLQTNSPGMPSFGTILLAIVAGLFGLYEIGCGFYAYRKGGFKFYIPAHLLIGLPFLVIGVYLFLGWQQHPTGWEALFFVSWALGLGWKSIQIQKARRDHPLEWENWEKILNGKKY